MISKQPRKKRTVGKPLKYMFNIERILVAISDVCEVDGDYGGSRWRSWRADNGFWGKVVTKLGLQNKSHVRKIFYMRWLEDRKGLRSQHANTVMERNATPEVSGMDVSNLFNFYGLLIGF